jgi:glycosyltransferase involved in cell wall biosynthesis
MSKVSVVMPVYNVERYVAGAVASVLAQTHENVELLVVDDLSPDNSVAICESFGDPRIRILRHRENRGLAGARNTGIRHATGDIIAFLDSDDLWLPTKLERHLAHLRKAPQVGVSYSRSAFIDDNGNSLRFHQMPKLHEIDTGHLLCRNPIGNGSAPVIRREALEAARFKAAFYGAEEDFWFDDRFRQSEDIECWIRMSILGDWRFEGIPEPLTLYRVNAGGLSANVLRQLESWERVIEKTRTYAPDVVARWERPARAYQLRYLARRAVRLRDGRLAVEFVRRALEEDWRILVNEPRRTLLTLVAAFILKHAPGNLYAGAETLAGSVLGAMQRTRIAFDKLR